MLAQHNERQEEATRGTKRAHLIEVEGNLEAGGLPSLAPRKGHAPVESRFKRDSAPKSKGTGAKDGNKDVKPVDEVETPETSLSQFQRYKKR